MFKGIGQLLKPGGICLAYGVSIGEPSFCNCQLVGIHSKPNQHLSFRVSDLCTVLSVLPQGLEITKILELHFSRISVRNSTF